LNPSLWDGLIACWSATLGNSGELRNDISGRNNDAINFGTTWTNSEHGPVWDFDADHSYIDVPDGIIPTTNWTLVQFVKTPASLAVGDGQRFAFGASGGSGRTYLGFHGSGTSTATVYAQISGAAEFGVGLVNANTWHSLVLQLDGTDGTVFIDGVPAGTRAAITYLSTDINIGSFNDGASSEWLGQIAYTAIYNRVLSSGELFLLASDPSAITRLAPRRFAFAGDVEPPTGAIMNQLQGSNLGADLFNGTLL
jgi:hypothetical protein